MEYNKIKGELHLNILQSKGDHIYIPAAEKEYNYKES